MPEQLTVPRPAEEVATPDVPRTVRLAPTKGFGRVLSPRELWRYRDLAFQLAARDVTIRYRQTAFGAAWAILQPIAFMAIFTFIFGRVAGIKAPGDIPYAIFALAGLVPWMFFANSFLLGAESLVLNQQLVAKIYFPRIFIPAAVVAAGCVDLIVSLLIFFVIIIVFGYPPGIEVLAVPPILAIAICTSLGAGTLLSAINVRYRDVRYIVPFATQMWFFLTPIVYPNEQLSEPWRILSAINPMVGVVEGFRWSVLGIGSAPLDLMAISAGAAGLLLLVALTYFDRTERSFADVI